MTTVAHAIASLRPEAQFVLQGDDFNSVVWVREPETPISQGEIEAEIARLQAEYDAKAYARSRATEYPPIGDQLDALFHAGVFPEEMAAKIQAVKDKYPKGGA
jgi:uncharacterized small protein (DUF1192 family)